MDSNFPVALITGSGKRIGKSIALDLHRQGYSIIIHYNQNKRGADLLSAELNTARKDSAIALWCDLNDDKAIRLFAKEAHASWGRIDVLVNNASVFNPDTLGDHDTQMTQWQETFDVNVKANFVLSQALKSSLSSTQGCIINLVDIYSNRPLKHHSIYSTSKAASAMLTKSLAVELAPDIRVNGISPGAILWPEQGMPEEKQQEMLNKIPLGKLGSTQAIVEAVNFLIKCDYVTGQIINVDGGRSITM